MPSFLPEHCITLSRAISPSVCDEIIKLGKDTWTDYGQIGGGEDGFRDDFTRKSGVAWLKRESTLSDGRTVFDHITPHIREVNSEVFKFDLNFHETYQFTSYKAPDEKYSWHCDGHFEPYSEEDCKNDPNIEERVGGYRKLSYSVNLSHPDEYEGGHFEWTDPFGLSPQNMTPEIGRAHV